LTHTLPSKFPGLYLCVSPDLDQSCDKLPSATELELGVPDLATVCKRQLGSLEATLINKAMHHAGKMSNITVVNRLHFLVG